MGNQSPRNYVTHKYAGVSTSYVEVTEQFASYFTIYSPAEGLLVSIGHDAPADATSIEIAAGGSFSLPTGVVGRIFVKSLTGTLTDAMLVGA